jgi:dihydroorotase
MKEAECCLGGVFGAPTALQTYTQVFDEESALDNFEKFVPRNGSRVMTAIEADTGDVVVFQGGTVLAGL